MRMRLSTSSWITQWLRDPTPKTHEFGGGRCRISMREARFLQSNRLARPKPGSSGEDRPGYGLSSKLDGLWLFSAPMLLDGQLPTYDFWELLHTNPAQLTQQLSTQED